MPLIVSVMATSAEEFIAMLGRLSSLDEVDGAAVVAVGTASFRDPLAAERILAELRSSQPLVARSAERA